MSGVGALRFARFGQPPNALGLCGPSDTAAVAEAVAAGRACAELTALARAFEGAWPYLELIAGANRLDDPLHPAVVEAYWVGNALLRRVPAAATAAVLSERAMPRDRSLLLASVAGAGKVVPHHQAHVLLAYPWLGLLRAGFDVAPLSVLDGCRIAPATVVDVGAGITVLRRHLVWDGLGLARGHRVLEVLEPPLGVAVRPGDLVAVHWDRICDLVRPEQATALDAMTMRWSRTMAATPAAAG